MDEMKHSLFIGRFSPIHNGHLKIIQMMKNPIVVIVKGAGTSLDKKSNPFDADYQLHLMKKACPGIDASISPNGYLPGILGYLKKQGKEVDKIYCGADRIASYKAALDAANKKNEDKPEWVFSVTFVETPRYTSATEVREAIRAGDESKFKSLVPKSLWDEYKIMKECLSFRDFISK